MTAFEKWCLLRGAQPIPASPTSIAKFISEVAELGIARVWDAVVEISHGHRDIGLPDPTLGIGIVTAEINKISEIKPPHSWKKEEQHRFMSLPYDLQCEILRRETERERELRRLQNTVADLKRANSTVAA